MASKVDVSDENMYQSSKIEEPEEPSHYIIQQQLQDVILTQQAAYEKLKKSVSGKEQALRVDRDKSVLIGSGH